MKHPVREINTKSILGQITDDKRLASSLGSSALSAKRQKTLDEQEIEADKRLENFIADIKTKYESMKPNQFLKFAKSQTSLFASTLPTPVKAATPPTDVVEGDDFQIIGAKKTGNTESDAETMKLIELAKVSKAQAVAKY